MKQTIRVIEKERTRRGGSLDSRNSEEKEEM
jgi:hypothetical protein